MTSPDHSATHAAAVGRSERTTAAILAAAGQILAESGVEGLTVEGVSARSGVAKTSIYRRFAGRLEIALAVLMSLIPGVRTTPNLGDTRRELIYFVERTIKVLRTSPLSRVMTGIVSDLATNAELAAMFRVQLVGSRMAESERILRLGIERGEIAPDVVPELVHELLVGPVYFRLLLSGEPLRATFATQIVDAVLPGLRPRPQAAARTPGRERQTPPPA